VCFCAVLMPATDSEEGYPRFSCSSGRRICDQVFRGIYLALSPPTLSFADVSHVYDLFFFRAELVLLSRALSFVLFSFVLIRCRYRKFLTGGYIDV
jgi:hypothetical protein